MARIANTSDIADFGSRTRRRRAAAVVLGALLIVGIPLSRLGSDTSSRFGWQMFSSGSAQTEFAVVEESGESYDVDPADYVAILRSQLPIEDRLPQHLCTVEPGATAIIVRTADAEETVICPPA